MLKNLFLLLFNLCTLVALAQQNTGADKTVPLFFEKVYVHTDRDIYSQGDDIWYKAYLVNAQNDQPINYSHLLYVELIDPSANIISRQVLRVDTGLANGDLKFGRSVPEGMYRLRAYTNWMRNFGDNFIFEKQIRVVTNADPIALTKGATDNKKNKDLPVAASRIDTDTLTYVRFFPEGGSMVSGVSSVIGVKAEDVFGRGMEAIGEVIDNSDRTVARFTCDSLGFGQFTLLPGDGQHYQAIANIRGQRHRFILPDVAVTGFNLMVANDPSMVTANVNCNDLTINKLAGTSIYVVAKHGGKTYFKTSVLLNAKNIPVNIRNSLLPGGIACITVADEHGKPLCERLIYIDHPNNIQLSVKTDRATYQPKGKVTVRIKLNANVKASLSLAAVNAATIPVKAPNIISYLNLQSEIKGHIDNPSRYFDTTNTDRFKQLDLLLLTQGWRNFVWKKLEDTTLTLAREVEPGITITGKVRKVWAKAGLSGINVTMNVPQAKTQKLFWTSTDTAGRFAINDPMIYGHQFLTFTSRRGDQINEKGESKGFSGGWLQVDSLFQDRLAVDQVRLPRDTTFEEREALYSIQKLIKSLNLKADHNLKEVTIKGLHLREPPQIHPITLTEQREFENVMQYLMYMIPGAYTAYLPCAWCTGNPHLMSLYIGDNNTNIIYVTASYADGSPINTCTICQEQYLNLPMSNVMKITITRTFSGTLVHEVLRPGVLESKEYYDNTVADVNGYYKARVFYTPTLYTVDDRPDPRTNTLHWEPNVSLDSKGEATITYNNTDLTSDVRLVVQGITNTGTPIVATAGYAVK